MNSLAGSHTWTWMVLFRRKAKLLTPTTYICNSLGTSLLMTCGTGLCSWVDKYILLVVTSDVLSTRKVIQRTTLIHLRGCLLDPWLKISPSSNNNGQELEDLKNKNNSRHTKKWLLSQPYMWCCVRALWFRHIFWSEKLMLKLLLVDLFWEKNISRR